MKKYGLLAEITIYLLVIAFMVLFGYTGMAKAAAFKLFRDGLQDSPFIPAWSAGVAAAAAITAMLGIPISLLIGFWKAKFMESGLSATLVLMAFFTLYVAAILTIAPYKPCLCIGLDERLGLGWEAHLLFNIALLAVTWTAKLLYHINGISGSGKETDNNKLFAAADGAHSQLLKNGKRLKERRYLT